MNKGPLFRRSIEIVGERTLQPLYHIDFIWNLTKAAKKLKESYQTGRIEFKNVQYIFNLLFLLSIA